MLNGAYEAGKNLSPPREHARVRHRLGGRVRGAELHPRFREAVRQARIELISRGRLETGKGRWDCAFGSAAPSPLSGRISLIVAKAPRPL